MKYPLTEYSLNELQRAVNVLLKTNDFFTLNDVYSEYMLENDNIFTTNKKEVKDYIETLSGFTIDKMKLENGAMSRVYVVKERKYNHKCRMCGENINTNEIGKYVCRRIECRAKFRNLS